MPVLAGIAAGLGESAAEGQSDFEDKKRTIVSEFAEAVRMNKHWGVNELMNHANALSMGNQDLRSFLPGPDDMLKIAERNLKVRLDEEYTIDKRSSDAKTSELDKHYNQIIGQKAMGSDPFPDDRALTDTLAGARDKWLKDKALDAEDQHWLRPLDDSAGGLYAWVQGQTNDLRETKKTAAAKRWALLKEGHLSDPAMTPDRYGGLQEQFKGGFGSILDQEFWGSTMMDAASAEAELARRKQLRDSAMSTQLAQETSALRALEREISTEFEKRIGRGEKQDAAIAATLSTLGITKPEDVKTQTDKLKKLDISVVEASRLRALYHKYKTEIARVQGLGKRPISAEEISTMTGIPVEAKLVKLLVQRGQEDFDETHTTALNEAEPALRDAMAKGKPMSWWLSTKQNEDDKWEAFLTYLQQVNHPDLEKISKDGNRDYMWKKINQALHQTYDWEEGESWNKRTTDRAQHVIDLQEQFGTTEYADKVKSTLALNDEVWSGAAENIQDLGSGWTKEGFLTAIRSGVLNLFMQGDNNFVYDPSIAPMFVSALVQHAVANAKQLTDGQDPSDPATIEAWIRSNAPSVIAAHAQESRMSPLRTQREWIEEQADVRTSASAGPAYITEEDYMKESDARVTQAENFVNTMREHLQLSHLTPDGMEVPLTAQGFREQFGPDMSAAYWAVEKSIEHLVNQAQMYERNPGRMRHTDARNRVDLQANVQKLVALQKELNDIAGKFNIGDPTEPTTSNTNTGSAEPDLEFDSYYDNYTKDMESLFARRGEENDPQQVARAIAYIQGKLRNLNTRDRDGSNAKKIQAMEKVLADWQARTNQ